jgi:hypothetical protein
MDAILNVRVKQGKLSYKDTAQRSLFQLPPAARILDFYIDVTEAFDDTGTDQVDVGTKALATNFVTAADVSTQAWLSGALVAKTNLGQYANAPTEIFGRYTGSNANSAHGQATVYCLYATPFD